MTERNHDMGASGPIESNPEAAESASSRSRLIASAIALLSSAALVTWAAMHSHM